MDVSEHLLSISCVSLGKYLSPSEPYFAVVSRKGMEWTGSKETLLSASPSSRLWGEPVHYQLSPLFTSIRSPCPISREPSGLFSLSLQATLEVA